MMKEHDVLQKTLYGMSFALSGLALIASLFFVFPGKTTTPQLPSFGTSWEVATETIKSSPLFGAGPGNYLTAFNRFRPLSYNSTPNWNTRFVNATNFYLTVLTETGLLGFAGAALIFLTLFRAIRSGKSAHIISAVLLSVVLLFVPVSPVSFVIYCIVLALSFPTTAVSFTLLSHKEGHGEIPLSGRIPSIVAALPVLVISVIALFQCVTIVRAEALYQKALERAIANDGRGAYDGLRNTITVNPFVDRYRISYAQINIALANAISQDKNLSDADKTTVSQLVQQAIREGKAAVALNPGRAGNWELLASIYRSVIPLAQGADQFAVQTYAQAVALDPFNPLTRLSLGGLFYSAKNYDEAINQYRLAVQSKPDYANSNYNLATAYRQKGDTKNAQTFLDRTLSLVSKDSDDYKKVQKELEELKKNAPVTPSGTPSGELQTPESLTTPENPTITLPEEATPPATPVE
jgi:tetratricopeptide (TPR) repeat protein